MVLALLACVKGPGWSAPPGTSAALVVTPDSSRESLAAALTEAGLEVVPLPAPAGVVEAPTTSQKLALVPAEQDLTVIVHSDARFFSQLNGRFRWVVEVDMVVAPSARPEEALTEHYEVPVFLQFQRQDASDAIAASAPIVERRVQESVAQVLGAP